MAKKQIKQKSIESTIWEAANKLRGSVEPAEYKHVVLSLIFLKYANDKFDEQRNKLLESDDKCFVELPMFYEQDNVFFIPECARWEYLMKNAKQEDIAIKIDTALNEIEKKNVALAGALPDNYYSRLHLGKGIIGGLLDTINGLNLNESDDKDIFGRVYEYCLKKFAISEGKGKGEFYTPKTVVELLCELIEPYKGIIYDGACGSGGMFVQSAQFIKNHKGNTKEISVYGQEKTDATRRLAMMNLALRGISANFGEMADSTFTNDMHKDLKADFVLMNPPFNLKAWRDENGLLTDERWAGYDTPPVSNANYAWLLNMNAKLKSTGVGAMILANGAIGSTDLIEASARKQMIENDLVEAIIVLPRDMFYATDISVTVWIINKDKKAKTIEKNGEIINLRDRTGEILFIDYRQGGHINEEKYMELNAEDRAKIADTYHQWQKAGGAYSDVPEYCYSAKKDEIAKKNYTLMPSKYIEFVDHDLDIDYEKEMKRIQDEMKTVMSEEQDSQKMLTEAFGGIGYGIEEV